MVMKATLTYVAAPDILEKTMKKSVRESLKLAVAEWKAKFLDEHFKSSAVSKYAYTPRKKVTQIIKAKKYKQTAPLVQKGTLKRMADASNKITGSAKQATLSLNVPDYVMRPAKNSRVKVRDELTAVTDKEANELAVMMNKYLQQTLNAIRERTTK